MGLMTSSAALRGTFRRSGPGGPAPEQAGLLDRLGDVAQGRADPLEQVLTRPG